MTHASHVMHSNSVEAYHAEESRLSKRARAVLAWVTRHGPMTDRQIAYGMGYGENLNACRPRISELIEDGFLVEVGNIRCPVTGKTVRKVGLPPIQGALWS